MPAPKDKPKSLDHRAKITASMRWDKEQYPEEWQAEYELALEIIKRRKDIAQGKILVEI